MSSKIPAYAELHCRSAFHFLCGASKPSELAKRAADLQLRALAITDADGLYGAVRQHLGGRAEQEASETA